MGYLTTFQAAKLMAVTPDSVLKWIKSGKLEARRTLGGHYRISIENIELLLKKSCRTKVNENKNINQYCWEFNIDKNNCEEDCQECLVYKSRAKRCYELSDFPQEFGILKRYCKTTCDKCEYYKLSFSQN